MNTYTSEQIRLAPMRTSSQKFFEFLGKAWNEHLFGYSGTFDQNVNRGKKTVGAALFTTGLILLASCGENSTKPNPTIEAKTPCVAPTNETITHKVVAGDTTNGMLLEIAGVEYGTCLDTALNMAISMNGEEVTTPREGETFIFPAKLVPASEFTVQG